MNEWNKNEAKGRDFAPKVDIEIYQVVHREKKEWKGTISIDDMYYETDPHKERQGAENELRGCLLAIKEQIEKHLMEL